MRISDWSSDVCSSDLWCVARDITHAGAIRQYVEIAAEAGMIGLAMTASGPMMAYQGSKGAVVSTNPIAIAVPAAGGQTLILDLERKSVVEGERVSERVELGG